MRMPWFRMYHEARNDRKLDTLADDEYRVWHKLLCMASEQDERGVIEYDDRELLAIEVARGDVTLLSRTVTRLIALRIVTDNGHALTFVNFIARNYDKPSETPEATRERKRKSRANARESAAAQDMSRDVTPGHTPEEKREEKRREEESRSHPPLPPTPAPAKPAPPRGGGRVRAAPKPSTLNADQRERFDRWYPTYPNKQHRPEAEKAFARLDPDDATTAAMVTDTAVRQGGRKWAEGYIEHPATYLNNRVWEDDIEPVRAAPIPLHGSTELIGKDRERAEVMRRVLARRGIHGPGGTDADPATHGGGVSRLADRTRA